MGQGWNTTIIEHESLNFSTVKLLHYQYISDCVKTVNLLFLFIFHVVQPREKCHFKKNKHNFFQLELKWVQLAHSTTVHAVFSRRNREWHELVVGRQILRKGMGFRVTVS